jgi:hypothetical protein
MQHFVGDNSDKLQVGEVNEEFKQKLLDLILQTTTILEEYY